MKTIESHFGKFEGQEVQLYTLQNDCGMQVKITNYGATITSIVLPRKNGNPEEIVFGFDNFESYFVDDYQTNAPYFVVSIGYIIFNTSAVATAIVNGLIPKNG